MNNLTRRTKISEYINREEWASVEDLAKKFFVSLETIRRDLGALETQRLVVRRYGGAFSTQTTDIGTPFNTRKNENASFKRVMAQKALRFIEEGMAIGLDASTSSWYLAKQLPDIDLTVVTNGLEIAQALRGRHKVKVLCPGGEYVHKYECFVGPFTDAGMRNFSLDVAFVASFGIDKDTGAWDSNEVNAMTKRVMLSVARKRVLLADPSKFWRRNLFNMAGWDTFGHLVLARAPEGEDAEALGKLDLEVV
jgi:DeoR family transcriptional regulator, L-fucose operon activator